VPWKIKTMIITILPKKNKLSFLGNEFFMRVTIAFLNQSAMRMSEEKNSGEVANSFNDCPVINFDRNKRKMIGKILNKSDF
jgi:hypothetical protein